MASREKDKIQTQNYLMGAELRISSNGSRALKGTGLKISSNKYIVYNMI